MKKHVLTSQDVRETIGKYHLEEGVCALWGKLWLLIAMVFTGIIYATVLLYFMPMSQSNNILLHCILLGALFGVVNFIVAVLYYRRHEKLKSLNQQLKSSLMTDSLTGLLNRRAFDQDIEHVDNSGSYSLIFLDIDNFRNFNNHFGHDIGDNVLKMVGEKPVSARQTGFIDMAGKK